MEKANAEACETAPHSGASPRLCPLAALAALARAVLIGLVRVYQYTLGLILPNACRFTPTCSEYFVEAVRRHGPLRGSWLGLRRLLRCQPFCKGGHDPVP